MLAMVDHRSIREYGDRLDSDVEFVISGEVVVDKRFLLPDEFVSDSVWLTLHHPDIGVARDYSVRTVSDALALLRTEVYNPGVWHHWSIDIYRTVAKNHHYVTMAISITNDCT